MKFPKAETSRASYCLLQRGGEKEALSELCQTFGVSEAGTSGRVINKPMLIIEPSLLYPSNDQLMINKDFSSFM